MFSLFCSRSILRARRALVTRILSVSALRKVSKNFWSVKQDLFEIWSFRGYEDGGGDYDDDDDDLGFGVV
jgi:hypothetical protein